MKKGIKVFISGLITFLSLEAIASARVLSYTELQKEIEKVNPEAVEARIIGNYVFTDANKLRDQDIMIGALTIPGIGDGKHFTQELYNKMSVNRLLRKINPDTGDYENWSIINNLFGETKITEQTSFDIRYIDYTYLKDTFTVSFNLDGGSFKEKDKTLSVLEDDKIDKTLITGENAPTRSGKKFKAWVKDDGTPWNFETDIVTGNMTLKATWYDEVNTNTLLEQSVSKIVKNEFYGEEFKNKILIYNIYDKNKKNSEIKDTGLVGNIRDALNTANVISITVSYKGKDYTFNDASMSNGESEAYKKLKELLAAIAEKEFTNIVQGDLLGKGDLKLTIHLDEKNARSQDNNVEESYTIKFSYDAKSTISGTIPENDVKVLQSSYNYVPTEDKYTVTGSDGEYKVSGYVIEQDGVKGFGTSSAKHYFAYSIHLDDNVDTSKVKIKVPKNASPSSDSDYNIYNGSSLDNGVLTVLMEVEDNEKVKYRDIIIEVDGKPTKVRIDFSELKLKKSSKFTIQSVDDVVAAGTQLGEDFGWEKKDGFKTEFAIVGDKVTVTGLIPILDLASNGKTPFKEEDLTGYYLPFVIKTEKGDKEQNAKLTVQFIHEGEESKTITAESFDGNDVLYILRHLHKDATNRTFKIVVDMDGTGEEYAPYELTFDWNGLKLQQSTVPNVQLNKPSTQDTEELNNYGYDRSKNELVPSDSENSLKLSGTMKEQAVDSSAFGVENINGYYFDFTFTIPDGIDRNKVRIARLNDSELSNGIKKEFSNTEWQDDGTLTILFRVPEDTKCVPSSENCKLYYQVDYDGDEHEYLPTIYTVDYSSVIFEKSSLFTIEKITDSNKGQYDDTAWYDTEDGYNVNIEKDEHDPNKYNVSGVLPIIEESDWDNSREPFEDGGSRLYYLGLGLKLANAPAGYNNQLEGQKLNILFDHDAESDSFKPIFGNDFEESQTIYILKALKATGQDGNSLKDEEKYFTITVDLDGDDGSEYAPYTVTIDYSDLEFQNESLGGVDFNIIDEATLDGNSLEKKELESYGFNPETVKDVSIKMEQLGGEDREASKTGLQGNIKEQTLENGFNNNTGYFVPIKISVPTKEEWFSKHQNDWTITLNTEKEGEKTYTPSTTEYEQGWVLVLFRIDETKNEIKYKIDFDGKGDAFLPTEYVIKYEDLAFLTENKIKFEYFDEISGQTIVTEEETVYQGEPIPVSIAPQFEDKNYSYHEFDYWYDKEKGTSNHFDFETGTTGKNEDLTLKAHWTIDVDKFLADVVKDLASIESEITKDYSNIFEISKSENTITFKVLDTSTKLSELSDTSIPGAIAYILQRGEVKDITLAYGGKKVVFTKEGYSGGIQSISLDETGLALKEKVKAGAKALFVDVLGSDANEQNMTLNQMAVLDNDFTLTIGTLDDSVKLPDDAKTAYTFDFETDVAPVNSEETLTAALKNSKISHIDIVGDFEVTHSHEIIRPIVLNGEAGDSNKHTITANSSDSVFVVKAQNVTIDNLKLADATKSSIVVESGALTATGIEIVNSNTLPETFETGIEVKNGATLIASNMKFEKENYEHPIVRKDKTGDAKVTLTDNKEKVASQITKEKITTYEESQQGQGDTISIDSSYQYYNYYNDDVNSQIYLTSIWNMEAGYRWEFKRYNYYGDELKLPTMGDYKNFSEFTKRGHTYTLLGFATWNIGGTTPSDGSGECTLPEGVISKDKFKVTSNGKYFNAYCIKLKDGATKVKDAQTFKEALGKNEITEIYIESGSTIDLSTEDINITRQLTISGQDTTAQLKVKSINITADSVFMEKLQIEGHADGSKDALITISSDATKFTLWQSKIKNVGSSVKYAIDYSGDKASIDSRWNTFENDNISDAYINVKGALAEGTNVYANTFKAITSSSKTSAITVKKFDATAKEQDSTSDISFDANTFNTDYAIRFSDEISDQEAAIELESSKEVIVAIDYTDSHNQFDKINIISPSFKNIKVKYLKDSGSEEEDKPGDKGTSVKITVPMLQS